MACKWSGRLVHSRRSNLKGVQNLKKNYLLVLLAGTLTGLVSCSVPSPRRETVDFKVELGEVTLSEPLVGSLIEPRSESLPESTEVERSPSPQTDVSVRDAGDDRAASPLTRSHQLSRPCLRVRSRVPVKSCGFSSSSWRCSWWLGSGSPTTGA